MSIARATVSENNPLLRGALFMEIPSERISRVGSDLDLLIVHVQEVARYLCLVYIIPDDMFSDFQEACCSHPENPTLFGEIWDEGNQRYISATSLDCITRKISKNHTNSLLCHRTSPSKISSPKESHKS